METKEERDLYFGGPYTNEFPKYHCEHCPSKIKTYDEYTEEELEKMDEALDFIQKQLQDEYSEYLKKQSICTIL